MIGFALHPMGWDTTVFHYFIHVVGRLRSPAGGHLPLAATVLIYQGFGNFRGALKMQCSWREAECSSGGYGSSGRLWDFNM